MCDTGASAVAIQWFNNRCRSERSMEAIKYYPQYFRSIIHLTLQDHHNLVIYLQRISWPHCGINKILKPQTKETATVAVAGFTSWKKLQSGYKLLRAILKEVGATAFLLLPVDAMFRAMKISYKAHKTQGSPTWTCSEKDLPRNSSRNRLKCHKDWMTKIE